MIRIPTALRALCALVLVCPLPAAAEVFINEIHYDNGGTDVGEAVEVVATSGEDLAEYSIVLYNGSGGVTYDTDVVGSGSDVNCGSTVRIATVIPGQIQNGPDGMALVHAGSSVVQFLSYGGSFTATNGPAAGMVSEDIGVSEGGSTLATQSLQLSGSGTTYADFDWQAPATATFGGCNNGQTFGTPVDNPPVLSSSVPVDGALDFPANANLVLTFSEPVHTDPNWFTLSCTLSGVINEADTSVSGTDSVRTINPNSDLADGDECTLTLESTAITDQDGTLDLYVGTTRIAFTAVEPPANAPPVVLSTTPMDGDDDFPGAADLVVLFSEAVNLGAGAFTLVCDTTSGIVLSYPSSGTSFTIDTGTVLVGAEPCVFTIEADAVADLEGANLAGDVIVEFDVATSSVGGYYAQVNTSSPEQLRCSLHQVIKGHTSYPYTASTTDTWDVLNIADEDPVDPTMILDVYKNERYIKITGGTGVYNREHTWPNTYGFSGGSPGAYTDVHMLHLTNTQYNSDRGSKPFADCTSGCTELPTTSNYGVGGGGGGDSNYVADPGNETLGSFEVWDHLKGNMARAMFYMAVRYDGGGGEPDLELTDDRSRITSAGVGGKHYMGLLTHLIAWHAFDPPDAREIERNEVVFTYQGNRNPFVDHPEWASLALFQATPATNCELNDGNLPPEVFDDAYTVDEDGALMVGAPGVLGNDSDNESDPFTAQLVSDVLHGVLSLDANGSFDYAPADDYCGDDSFSYRAADATGTSATAIASITVTCINDPPTAGSLPDRSGEEGVAIATFSVASAFSDVDEGDTLDFTATGLPPGLSLDIASGVVSGTPQAGSAAGSPYTVTVTATDDGAQQASAVFGYSISGDPLPPRIFGSGFEN